MRSPALNPIFLGEKAYKCRNGANMADDRHGGHAPTSFLRGPVSWEVQHAKFVAGLLLEIDFLKAARCEIELRVKIICPTIATSMPGTVRISFRFWIGLGILNLDSHDRFIVCHSRVVGPIGVTEAVSATISPDTTRTKWRIFRVLFCPIIIRRISLVIVILSKTRYEARRYVETLVFFLNSDYTLLQQCAMKPLFRANTPLFVEKEDYVSMPTTKKTKTKTTKIDASTSALTDADQQSLPKAATMKAQPPPKQGDPTSTQAHPPRLLLPSSVGRSRSSVSPLRRSSRRNRQLRLLKPRSTLSRSRCKQAARSA